MYQRNLPIQTCSFKAQFKKTNKQKNIYSKYNVIYTSSLKFPDYEQMIWFLGKSAFLFPVSPLKCSDNDIKVFMVKTISVGTGGGCLSCRCLFPVPSWLPGKATGRIRALFPGKGDVILEGIKDEEAEELLFTVLYTTSGKNKK